MVIEKLHGLQATGLSLNERFTMLQSGASDRVAMLKARRRNINMFRDPNINFRNRALIEQIALKLQQQAKRRALRQRMGLAPGALRRFGSESSLPGLWRANSFSNISFNSQGNKFNQRQGNRNIRRWSSSGNLSGGRGRGARGVRGARGRGRGVRRTLRGRLGDGQMQGRVGRTQPQAQGGRPARGRGRGGVTRKQTNKSSPTKEELDLQLDEYMASSKSALDKELDTYMKNAMEFE